MIHRSIETPDVGNTHAPGVAGRALASSAFGPRWDGGTGHMATPPEFSARARKTAPEAGTLPIHFPSSFSIFSRL